ncbi:MAG: isochorismatase family cysteine hydrolase [Clostridia bacterium]|nr:isochorismatase family cysteine hydrolase [Clostridia bacterium]MDO5302789.1 isochorismatase family cysteine hydrolase [Clostridia bacterium]
MANDKILIVIDMQNDFVTDALENKEAQLITDGLAAKVEEYMQQDIPVFFTRDTHAENYMETQEGKFLPVPHCIKGTKGWEIIDALSKYADESNTLDKLTFGAVNLPAWLESKLGADAMNELEEIQLCGVCTDICVISNAMILKGSYPEKKISVLSEFCAGVTPESHETALNAMKSCQMYIL